MAHGPSCSVACGIFPDQGSNPCPLHWQADSQPLRHQGSPVVVFLRETIGSGKVGIFLAGEWWRILSSCLIKLGRKLKVF